MPDTSQRSASVTAAAVVAILAGAFLALTCSLGFFGILLIQPTANPALPLPARTALLVMMAIFIAASIYGIITGVALLLLRNWARISILIWAGFFVCFGAIGIPFAFFLPTISPPNAPQLPESSQRLMLWLFLVFYSLPLLVGIWWLILFNRKAVKEQFTGTGDSTGAGLPAKPRCPLPIAILAWLYLTSILNLLLLPFFPVRIPVFVFGLALPSKAGLALLILTSLCFFAGGWGLLKLKPWSYSLTIGLQMFWLASTAASLLNPAYSAAFTSYMHDFHAWLHLPETQFSGPDFAHHFGSIMAFSLLFGGAILALLVYYRKPFLEAAARAASTA